MYSERSLGLTQGSGFPPSQAHEHQLLTRKALLLLLSLLASGLPRSRHFAMTWAPTCLRGASEGPASACIILVSFWCFYWCYSISIGSRIVNMKRSHLSQWCKSSTKSGFTLVLCQNNCKLNMNERKSNLYSWPAFLSQLLPRTISYL